MRLIRSAAMMILMTTLALIVLAAVADAQEAPKILAYGAKVRFRIQEGDRRPRQEGLLLEINPGTFAIADNGERRFIERTDAQEFQVERHWSRTNSALVGGALSGAFIAILVAGSFKGEDTKWSIWSGTGDRTRVMVRGFLLGAVTGASMWALRPPRVWDDVDLESAQMSPPRLSIRPHTDGRRLGLAGSILVGN
jgi:hypothetical protein